MKKSKNGGIFGLGELGRDTGRKAGTTDGLSENLGGNLFDSFELGGTTGK